MNEKLDSEKQPADPTMAPNAPRREGENVPPRGGESMRPAESLKKRVSSDPDQEKPTPQGDRRR